MAASTARQAVKTSLKAAPSAAWLSSQQAFSLAHKLEQHALNEQSRTMEPALSQQDSNAEVRQEIVKSFSFHVGADLQIPTADKRKTHTPDLAIQAGRTVPADPFEGLPLKAWAERMGERIMPAYELIKEEQQKAKLAAKTAPVQEANVPAIPHLLPFTRWASKSQDFRETFVVEDPKIRKKARLSWYHPDDSMVPRDWFKGGLLEDLKYYAPFSRSKPAATT